MSKISAFSQIIKQGGIVAFPTETVYGLGASAFDPSAIEQVFNAKGRPSDNPLIVHVSNLKQLSSFTDHFDERARLLAEKFWPGPISLIFPKRSSVLDQITAGLPTVAIRIPNHSMALDLINRTGPLVAPSANKSGRPSPTSATHIREDFGEDIPILDGGHTTIGLESTVLDLTEKLPAILRPGSISKEQIESILNCEVQQSHQLTTNIAKSPGQKYSHYKPAADVLWIPELPQYLDPEILFLSMSSSIEKENLIGFNGDPDKMARFLYDRFRYADHFGYSQIHIVNFEVRADDVTSALKNRIDKATIN